MQNFFCFCIIIYYQYVFNLVIQLEKKKLAMIPLFSYYYLVFVYLYYVRIFVFHLCSNYFITILFLIFLIKLYYFLSKVSNWNRYFKKLFNLNFKLELEVGRVIHELMDLKNNNKNFSIVVKISTFWFFSFKF